MSSEKEIRCRRWKKDIDNFTSTVFSLTSKSTIRFSCDYHVIDHPAYYIDMRKPKGGLVAIRSDVDGYLKNFYVKEEKLIGKAVLDCNSIEKLSREDLRRPIPKNVWFLLLRFTNDDGNKEFFFYTDVVAYNSRYRNVFEKIMPNLPSHETIIQQKNKPREDEAVSREDFIVSTFYCYFMFGYDKYPPSKPLPDFIDWPNREKSLETLKIDTEKKKELMSLSKASTSRSAASTSSVSSSQSQLHKTEVAMYEKRRQDFQQMTTFQDKQADKMREFNKITRKAMSNGGISVFNGVGEIMTREFQTTFGSTEALCHLMVRANSNMKLQFDVIHDDDELEVEFQNDATLLLGMFIIMSDIATLPMMINPAGSSFTILCCVKDQIHQRNFVKRVARAVCKNIITLEQRHKYPKDLVIAAKGLLQKLGPESFKDRVTLPFLVQELNVVKDYPEEIIPMFVRSIAGKKRTIDESGNTTGVDEEVDSADEEPDKPKKKKQLVEEVEKVEEVEVVSKRSHRASFQRALSKAAKKLQDLLNPYELVQIFHRNEISSYFDAIIFWRQQTAQILQEHDKLATVLFNGISQVLIPDESNSSTFIDDDFRWDEVEIDEKIINEGIFSIFVLALIVNTPERKWLIGEPIEKFFSKNNTRKTSPFIIPTGRHNVLGNNNIDYTSFSDFTFKEVKPSDTTGEHFVEKITEVMKKLFDKNNKPPAVGKKLLKSFKPKALKKRLFNLFKSNKALARTLIVIIFTIVDIASE